MHIKQMIDPFVPVNLALELEGKHKKYFGPKWLPYDKTGDTLKMFQMQYFVI